MNKIEITCRINCSTSKIVMSGAEKVSKIMHENKAMIGCINMQEKRV